MATGVGIYTEMKPLKFKHEFVKEILKGRKTTTWRLFDDKNLKIGDKLEIVNRDSGESFAKATITDIQKRRIKDLTDQELKNHGYSNISDMIDTHRGYYGDKVNVETEVKIIEFKLLNA